MSDFEQERWNKGMEILKQMGRQDTMTNQKELYPDLYNLSVGYLFGEIWSRPHLSIRDRELITMAANIALGRGFAGVHWRSDSIDGLGLGEAVAIQVLTEVKLTHTEMFAGFSFRRFDGSRVSV